MAQQVRFIRTTKPKYIARTTYDPTALYFCEDTGEIFKGEILFTHGIVIVPTRADLPECPCAADGVLYYVADTKSGFMMSPDRTEWLQTIYAPVADVTTIPEGEEYNVVTTVGAVRDIENAIYTYIDNEISNVESGVFNAQTHYDFPNMGKIDVIYKAESEKKIYQWNPIDLRYEEISVGGSLENVQIINGGNANE